MVGQDLPADPTAQQGAPAAPKAKPVKPGPAIPPDKLKTARAHVLQNLVQGKHPLAPIAKTPTAGSAPVAGTPAATHVQTYDDPTKDPNNQYYGVDAATLAARNAAQEQANQYDQQLESDRNAPAPTAPTYQAPQEDHVGRRNTAQIATSLLALLMGPGKHGGGSGNFLANLAGGMGQGRQQLMANKQAQAKEQFQAQEDQYKTGVEAAGKKQTADISLSEHAQSNWDRLNSQVSTQHKNAVTARDAEIKHQEDLADKAAHLGIDKSRLKLQLAVFQNTKGNEAWRRAFETQNQRNNVEFHHFMEGVALTNESLRAEEVRLRAQGLAFSESHHNTPLTQEQRNQIRMQSRQITLDQEVLSKLPTQTKNKVAAAHHSIFNAPNADGSAYDPSNAEQTKQRNDAFNKVAQAIYHDNQRLLGPIHSRMRAMGLDTSEMESDITSTEAEENEQYGLTTGDEDEQDGLTAPEEDGQDGVITTPEGYAPVPKNHPAAQPPMAHHAAPPAAHANTPPPVPAGMKLVGHQNGKAVYQDKNGKYFSE